jgi:hypothetical protein
MISLLSLLNLFELSLDWNEKMTFFLILFSAGLLCITCAILLAIYLLRSDRFLDLPKEESAELSYPYLEEESRLSKLKSKIIGFFKRTKNDFKETPQETEPLDQGLPETPKDLLVDDSKDELFSVDEEDQPP